MSPNFPPNNLCVKPENVVPHRHDDMLDSYNSLKLRSQVLSVATGTSNPASLSIYATIRHVNEM